MDSMRESMFLLGKAPGLPDAREMSAETVRWAQSPISFMTLFAYLFGNVFSYRKIMQIFRIFRI